MANADYTKQPVNRISDTNYSGALIRMILTHMQRTLLKLTPSATGGGGGGSGGGGSTAQRATIRWVANGPYQVGTEVDGGWVCSQTMTIYSVRLHRTTAGASGSTIVDINKNGTTIYTTQANRPTIAYDDADGIVLAVPPDVQAVATGDKLTVDIDAIETGNPASLTIMVEGA